MVKEVVIPDMNPGSRSFNKSWKPHDMLDSRFTMRCPGMTKYGFTLIELLVVVLIIGILSAVALPQYTKAVEKSRAAQALAVLKSLAAAEQSYYMANGQYANYFDELDVELPWSGAEKWYSMATDTRSNGEWSLQKVNSSQHKIIYIGRLTGKYKGGGFGYFLYDNSALYETDVITCMERTGAGTVFNEADGAYCRQVMGGTFKATQGSTRQYTLP